MRSDTPSLTEPSGGSGDDNAAMKTPMFKTALLLLSFASALPAFSQSNGAVSSSDQTFATKLATGSTNEVALSQLADTRSGSADVKSFAQMMIQDHGKLNSQLSDLCQRRGVDISAAIQKGQEKGVSHLSDKQGQDFDKAYLKVMVKGHKATLELLQDEIQNSKDSDFVSLANQALPVVKHHLDMAEQLEQRTDM